MNETGNNCLSHLPWGPIYRVVRELVYIVQTTPNCLVNRAKYKVTGSLQSFVI
jgi:hypothetical protein